MAVRSRPLWGPVTLASGGGLQTVYTVPADRTVVIRTIVVVNAGATAGTVTMNFVRSGVTGPFYPATSLAAASRIVDNNWYSLEEGNLVRINPGGGPNLTAWGFGSLLLGDPE